MREDTSQAGSSVAYSPGAGASEGPGLTLRSFTIGILGTVFVSVADYVSGGVLQNSFIVGTQLAPVVVVLFICLLAFNGLVKRVLPQAAMSRGEMLMSLGMVWVGSGVAAWGTVHGVLPWVVMPYRLSEKDPHVWGEIVKHIPAWMVPCTDADSSMVLDFDAGSRVIGGFEWLPWVRVLALWAIGFGGLYGFVLSLGTVCFRQWARAEKLPFPVAQVPLMLSEEPKPGRRRNDLLSSRGFWLGFLVVVFIGTLHGLHTYYPIVPEIKCRWDLRQFRHVRPFAYMHGYMFNGYIFFAILGVSLLIPLHMSLSIWLGFVLLQLYFVIAHWLGMPPTGQKNWAAQSGGALVYLLSLLYVGRGYYMDVLRAFWSKGYAAQRGLNRERVWAWCGLFSLVVIVCWFKATGLPLWTCLLLVMLMTLIFIILMRILAETGLVYIQFDFRPSTYVVELFHGHGLSGQHAAASIMTTPLCLEQRDHPMLVSHSAMYCNADRSWRPRRGFLPSTCAAMVVAYVVASIAGLLCIYYYGSYHVDRWCTIASGALGGPAWQAARTGQGAKSLTAAVVGAIVVGGLSYMRLHFSWWPLHPIGFLVGISYPGARIWSNVALGWFFKWALMRYGGGKMVPFAKFLGIGIMVGEAVILMFWVVVGSIIWLSGGESVPIEFCYY